MLLLWIWTNKNIAYCSVQDTTLRVFIESPTILNFLLALVCSSLFLLVSILRSVCWLRTDIDARDLSTHVTKAPVVLAAYIQGRDMKCKRLSRSPQSPGQSHVLYQVTACQKIYECLDERINKHINAWIIKQTCLCK